MTWCDLWCLCYLSKLFLVFLLRSLYLEYRAVLGSTVQRSSLDIFTDDEVWGN